MSKLKNLKIVVILIIVAVAILTVVNYMYHKDTPEVDTEYLNALVSKSGELTTAKLKYTGMTEYKDTGIAFINKADFIMVYNATIRAGIDVEKVKIESDDTAKKIYISVPKATVQDVKVDTGSIKYFDEKFALLNVNAKEDSNKAIAMAEKAAVKEAENMGILAMADEQSETLIKGILSNAIPDDYILEFKDE